MLFIVLVRNNLFFSKRYLPDLHSNFLTTTLPETSIAPENGWLEYVLGFLLGWPIFRCYVSFREGKPSMLYKYTVTVLLTIWCDVENPAVLWLGVVNIHGKNPHIFSAKNFLIFHGFFWGVVQRII